MGTPIYRRTREVQFAAGGRQIAQTFPLIGKRWRCNLPPAGGKLQRLFTHRKTWEVEFAAGGLQIAPMFPPIDARFSAFPEYGKGKKDP